MRCARTSDLYSQTPENREPRRRIPVSFPCLPSNLHRGNAQQVTRHPVHNRECPWEVYTLSRRLFFGDGDQQSLIEARLQNSKKGVLVAHSDYMMVLAFFDDDQAKPAGPLATAIQQLAEGYREQGY